MAYTEVKSRNGRNYYYRVISLREGNKVKKKRIYLGSNLSSIDLILKKNLADRMFRKIKINKSLILIKYKIIKILKKNNIKKAGIFGSYVRGEQKKNSDIDILIEPPRNMGLEFVGIALELEKKLGKKVDLLTYKGINPYLKKSILKEEVKII